MGNSLSREFIRASDEARHLRRLEQARVLADAAANAGELMDIDTAYGHVYRVDSAFLAPLAGMPDTMGIRAAVVDDSSSQLFRTADSLGVVLRFGQVLPELRDGSAMLATELAGVALPMLSAAGRAAVTAALGIEPGPITAAEQIVRNYVLPEGTPEQQAAAAAALQASTRSFVPPRGK